MKKRLLVGLAIVLMLTAAAGRLVSRHARAFATDYTLSSLNCNTLPGHIVLQNTSTAASSFDQLSITIAQAAATTTTKRVIDTVTAPGTTGGNYGLVAGGFLDEQVGPGASQVPAPPVAPVWPTPPTVILPTTTTTPPNTQTLAFSTSTLLTPGAIVTVFDQTSGQILGTAQCPTTTQQFVFYVSPHGFDVLPSGNPNPTCGPDLPIGVAPTDQNPGPCLTIQHAIDLATDDQTILVEAGNYEICSPIEVNKLVRITTNPGAASGTDVNPAVPTAASAGGGTPAPENAHFHVVLHSFYGQTIFHVTAVGYPSVNSPSNIPSGAAANVPVGTLINNNDHVLIDGFNLGGAFQPGAAAIFLDNDANTDVRNNVIGGQSFTNPFYTGVPCATPPVFPPLTVPTSFKTEMLGNATSILLRNSDHPNIWNNSILGSSFFSFVPVLGVTGATPQTGFGIATTECLGLGSDASDAAQISFNLIDYNANAGIWLCSDNGGGHLIEDNTVRNNGRGIVLRAITDTLLDANTISDDFQDAIVVYDAASNNTIQRNLIESQNTPGAAGIRLGGFGAGLFPLQTAVNNNTLRRNWVDIDIAGARSTTGSGNIITADSIRTGILIEVGSAGAVTYTQPDGTSFRQNQILYNGPCTATQGCAIRLSAGVTSNVDATQNNFGLPANVDVNTVLWHKPNDPSLGYIDASGVLVPAAPALTPGVGAPGAVGGGLLVAPAAVASATPIPGVTAPLPTSSPVIAPTPQGTIVSPSAGGAATTTSPVLSSGPAGGNTTYSPPCNFIPVPASVGSSITPGAFLSLFQPVANIYSAWRFDNSTHFFMPIYFADNSAPVAAITLHPGDVISLCVTDNVQGPP